MDLDHTAATAGVHFDRYVERVLHFLDTSMIELAILERFIESGDTRMLRQSTTRIGNGARGLGLRDIARSANELAFCACDGNLGGTIEVYTRLRRQLVFTHDVLRKQKAKLQPQQTADRRHLFPPAT